MASESWVCRGVVSLLAMRCLLSEGPAPAAWGDVFRFSHLTTVRALGVERVPREVIDRYRELAA
jgi:hypothetical protein